LDERATAAPTTVAPTTAAPTTAAPTTAAPTTAAPSLTDEPTPTTTDVAGPVVTGVPPVVLPDPPVLETPPLAGPHSICDRVPIEAYLMTNNVLYEGRAIESMWLCIQDAEFTPESSARLDSALTGSAVAPRIDQMCIEYYAAQNRPWTDAHAAICRP
ncbi:hypothetical protein NliqN6_2254, partial [Naganishia liquefaciens]